MSREKSDVIQQVSRWLRVGLLAFTMVGPAFNTLLAWLRQRSQEVGKRASGLQSSASDAGTAALQQLGDFTQESRLALSERAEYLQKQAQQLRAQAAQLRGVLRREKRQRRELNKTLEQLRQVGADWSQDLLARGEKFSSDLLERGSELSGNWAVRGSEVSGDLMERGGQLRRDLMERGSQLTQVLIKRGGEIGLEVGDDSGEQMLQPHARKRRNSWWAIAGFAAGLVAAATVTYLLIRRNILQQETDLGQQIELPQDQASGQGPTTRPAGRLRHIDGNGNSVATLQAVDAEQKVEAPADAAFVGVIGTKLYYPVGASIEAKDVVFFASEEEAESNGFARAVIE